MVQSGAGICEQVHLHLVLSMPVLRVALAACQYDPKVMVENRRACACLFADCELVQQVKDININAWLAGVCIQTRTGNIKGIQSIALSPDASMVVAGSDDTTARVYAFQHQ